MDTAVGSGQSAVEAPGSACVLHDLTAKYRAEIGELLAGLPADRREAAERMFNAITYPVHSDVRIDLHADGRTSLVLVITPSGHLSQFAWWLRREARRCARAVDPIIAPSPDCPLPTADCPPGKAGPADCPAGAARAPP